MTGIGLALLACVNSAFGWGSEGHRVIALIAASHLSPQAQARVRVLLAADAQAGPLLANGSDLGTAMAAVATWADEIKGQALGAGTDSWHFLDLAATDGAGQLSQRCPNNDCVTAQLQIMTANLQAGTSLTNSSNTYSLSQQLDFVIHFMGDLHQPLHCATNADAGGNCLATRGFDANELHATWDTGLVTQLFENAQGHKMSEQDLATALDAQFASQFTGVASLIDFDQIALESRDAAFHAAYGPMLQRGALPGVEPRPYLNVSVSRCATEAPNFYHIQPPVDLTTFYNVATLDAVRLQLAKAGYRLAAVLNNTLQ